MLKVYPWMLFLSLHDALPISLNDPDCVGVPEIRPVPELMLTPDGRAPARIDEVSAPTRPLLMICLLYATPCSPVGIDAVVMSRGPAMLKLSCLVTLVLESASL